MKKGMAISIQESAKGVSLQMTHVFGDFEQGFRAEKPEKLDLSLDRGNEMSRLAQHMQMRIVQKLGSVPPGQKDIPVMVGIQPSISGRLNNAFGMDESSGHVQVSNILGNMWTEMLRNIVGKRVRVVIGIGGFIDESDAGISLEDVPEAIIGHIHALIKDINNPRSLEALEEMAFQDGVDSVNVYRESEAVMIKTRMQRFSLFGNNKLSHESQIRFNYLCAHPLLKNAFVAGMVSKGVGSHKDIHHVCVKTPSDPKAPPYSNIAITMLADECARDEGRIPLGHVQEIV